MDLETGAVVTVATGDAGDSETILQTLPQAGENIATVAATTNHEEVGERVHPAGPREGGDRQGISQQRYPDGIWRKRRFGLTSRNQIEDGGAGRISWRRGRQCMATGGAFRARETVVAAARRVVGTQLRARL